NFQNRIISLNHWRKDEQWPDISTATLLKTSDEWLSPHLSQVRNISDLNKINLTQTVKNHFFTFEKLTLIDQLAPFEINVPSGSKIRLQYSPIGDKPILAARIQELFGQKETPRINEGRNEVLIHLLSPGFKPVQVTTDLANFWSKTYFEVKKELKGRYPKHFWPEDPLNAEAISGVKRKPKIQ
ncbi:MAG: ATP-dependent helicase C-terminal domain-containing protein, partial [Cyclobacteriaceae bacterium]